MISRFTFVLLLAGFVVLAQERFASGELKGFTKSPTEHIIERLRESSTVRTLEGIVGSKALDKPLKGVLIEIRGPGENEEFRSAVTDHQGRFRFVQIPDGDYTMKATLNGFRSVVGAISVRKSAKTNKPVRIEMLHGV